MVVPVDHRHVSAKTPPVQPFMPGIWREMTGRSVRVRRHVIRMRPHPQVTDLDDGLHAWRNVCDDLAKHGEIMVHITDEADQRGPFRGHSWDSLS